MQTITLQIKDEFMPVFMKMISGFDAEIAIQEHSGSLLKRDLSKLVAHPNAVNGNPDDIVNINWEQEWQHDLPK